MAGIRGACRRQLAAAERICFPKPPEGPLTSFYLACDPRNRYLERECDDFAVSCWAVTCACCSNLGDYINCILNMEK